MNPEAHRTSVLLLVGLVAVMGSAPLLMVLAWWARGRRDAAAAGERSRRPGGWLAVGIALVTVAAVGAAFYVAAARAPSSATGEMDGPGAPLGQEGAMGSWLLPDRIDALSLVQRVDGPEALAEVNRLHGLDVGVVSAEVATYGGSGSAEVWVATTASDDEAELMASAMAEGIAEGESPFAPPRRREGFPGVWATSGMGQQHFFFARGTGVWWVSTDPTLADRVLAEIVGLAEREA